MDPQKLIKTLQTLGNDQALEALCYLANDSEFTVLIKKLLDAELIQRIGVQTETSRIVEICTQYRRDCAALQMFKSIPAFIEEGNNNEDS